MVMPFRSNTAPLVTETAPELAPKAVALPTLSVPALIVVPPLYVLAPVRVNVLELTLVSAKVAPLITPLRAILPVPPTVLFAVIVTVPDLVTAVALVLIRAPPVLLRVLPEPATEILLPEVDIPFKSIKPPLVTVIVP